MPERGSANTPSFSSVSVIPPWILGIGDSAWSYTRLDAVADLLHLPFTDNTFDAALNVVTLEHVTDPARVISELFRCLRPGGRLLLVTPLEWEEHQQPHDYFRYTRYGLEYLTARAGFAGVDVYPVGGFFRLLSRRLLNSIQFFPGPLALVPAVLLGPLALALPLLDTLDKRAQLHPRSYMYRAKALTVFFCAVPLLAQHSAQQHFSGSGALEFTRALVAFGPRPIDSPAHRKMETYIAGKMRTFGCPVEQDTFTAQTPAGPKAHQQHYREGSG